MARHDNKCDWCGLPFPGKPEHVYNNLVVHWKCLGQLAAHINSVMRGKP